ncbi:choice-of-anchor V domain-containing protein [Polaribacter porphyrae]|uniref:Reelin domain-containing protein n=1 Tax=Polaribacter porphyrae TaxID=1137780 RepID=A0A2S7WK95_9FLAO|nr:choice-of-anchor V domain-containing protein [Polaribacter porphyrae]PQJ78028.1 hypothetical protein BTO18_01960 [Polaribacter porphyrae]
MKKNYIFKFALFLIPASAFILLSFSSGRNNGFSGSPGDGGNNCTACHTGTASNSNMTITTNIPVTGYAFNKQYDVTITNSDGRVRNGFQVTAEKDSDNSRVGTFIATTNETQAVNSSQRITHTSNGNGQSSWSFKWTSPSSDVGKITFYGASVSGNGSGSSGDQVYLGKSTSTPSLSIAEANRLDFKSFPNPARDRITIQLSSESDETRVEFYDNLGKLALAQKITSTNNKVDVNNLSSGIYILKVISDNKIGTQKFIKR